MTVRTLVTSMATLLVVALSATGASAYFDEDPEIDFVESEAWFTPTSNGVGNVDHAQGEYLGWSAQAPTATEAGMTVGAAHAVILDFVAPGQRENGSFTAEGTFTGYLDTIALDLYYDSPTDNLCGMGLAIDLDIDGHKVLEMDETATIPVVSEGAGDYYVAKVALTEIHAALTALGAAGTAETKHRVRILVGQYPLCQEALWLYGSTTAPSQLRFNYAPTATAIRYHTQWDVTDPPVRAPSAAPRWPGVTLRTF